MTSNDVARYLDSLSQHESYFSDAVLKSSEHEVTETVFRMMPDGQKTGPFIRKTIKRESGLGQAYERIFAEEHAAPDRTFRHIPHIHDCYLHNDELVVIMEYIAGETLQDFIYKHDPSLELVASIFPRICDAVIELHEAFTPPLIHRDLKPSNIMVTQDNVLVIDFGIAREYKDETDSDTMHFGTRAYAPPEQFGYGQTTVRSDVYALGMLLYFCLVEKTPEARSIEAGFPEQEIPEPLRNVIKQATAFDPNNRYANVREMKSAIETALSQLVQNMNASVTKPAPTSAPVSISEPASYATAAPKGLDPQTKSNQSATRKVVGIIWNMIIVFSVVITLIACIDCIVHVPDGMQAYPFWYNLLGYAFMIPLVAITIGFILSDKSRLKQRFPHSLGKLRWTHYLILGVGIILFTILCFAIASLFVVRSN